MLNLHVLKEIKIVRKLPAYRSTARAEQPDAGAPFGEKLSKHRTVSTNCILHWLSIYVSCANNSII
jgi:hypothetical protein